MSAFPRLSRSLEVYAKSHKYQGKTLRRFKTSEEFYAISHKYFPSNLRKFSSRNQVCFFKKDLLVRGPLKSDAGHELVIRNKVRM